jgi:4a-hydroxytetrahydrobiopterin dehydratase
MSSLSESPFEVCHKDTPPVSAEEANTLLAQIPEWEIRKPDGVMKLQRHYRFKNFVDALAFSNRVGELAEQQNHHPTILTEWGNVTLTWWTHLIHGLHRNDFIMAARSDEAYDGEK